jgi:hypothetical protein
VLSKKTYRLSFKKMLEEITGAGGGSFNATESVNVVDE